MLASLIVLLVLFMPSVLPGTPSEIVLVDFNATFISERLTVSNAVVDVARGEDANILRVTTGPAEADAVVRLKPEGKYWNLSLVPYLVVYVRNTGTTTCKVAWRLEDENGGSIGIWANSFVYLEPGNERRLLIALNVEEGTNKDGNRVQLSGLRSTPYGRVKRRNFDSQRATQFCFEFSETAEAQTLEIGPILALGSTVWTTPDDAPLFPFIDRYGQYIHESWNVKVHSDDDFIHHRNREKQDLTRNPPPADWNQYGSWKSGPTLKATGHFRVEKYDGKWWLVDPEGKLFFSNGNGCVSVGRLPTPITDRKKYFQDLPLKDDKRFGQFYSQINREERILDCFNFVHANLFRKYGEGWKSLSQELAHERMHSWGYNTLANWSDPDICFMRKTPYVLSTGSGGGKKLQGKHDNTSGFLRDVFSPDFATAVTNSISALEGSDNDPWCIGYFIDNELPWNRNRICIQTLESPASQPAKVVFVDMLKRKYGVIQLLNQVWRTSYQSWDALLQSREAQHIQNAEEDFKVYYEQFADRYFSVIAQALKKFAPNKLYLGSRFHGAVLGDEIMAAAAARHCDIVSCNIYKYPEEMARFRFPADMDVPLIIGEWHFGTLDRGMFDYGICYVEDHVERADHYIRYMKAVLAHPQFVGAHWFRYRNHPNTGRSSDSANAHNGVLDVCDTPYWETIEAAREVGHNLYQYRSKNKWSKN